MVVSLICWYMASGRRFFWHPESTSNLVVMLLIWTSNISFPSIDDVGLHPSCDFLSFIICVSRVWITIIITFTFISVCWTYLTLFEGHTFTYAKWCFFFLQTRHFLPFVGHWACFGMCPQKSHPLSCCRYDSFTCPTLNVFLSGGCNLPFYLILYHNWLCCQPSQSCLFGCLMTPKLTHIE